MERIKRPLWMVMPIGQSKRKKELVILFKICSLLAAFFKRLISHCIEILFKVTSKYVIWLIKITGYSSAGIIHKQKNITVLPVLNSNEIQLSKLL